MKDECQHTLINGPLQPGEVVVTSGGNSQWGSIIHAVCPTSNSTAGDPSAALQQVMLASLKEADIRQIKSVCMPLLGLNHFQFQADDARRQLRKALGRFFARPPKHLRTLRLFDMQQDIAMCLKKTVNQLGHTMNRQSGNPG